MVGGLVIVVILLAIYTLQVCVLCERFIKLWHDMCYFYYRLLTFRG